MITRTPRAHIRPRRSGASYATSGALEVRNNCAIGAFHVLSASPRAGIAPVDNLSEKSEAETKNAPCTCCRDSPVFDLPSTPGFGIPACLRLQQSIFHTFGVNIIEITPRSNPMYVIVYILSDREKGCRLTNEKSSDVHRDRLIAEHQQAPRRSRGQHNNTVQRGANARCCHRALQ